MERKQLFALAWKEFRQLRDVFLGMTFILAAISAIALSFQQDKYDFHSIQEMYVILLLISAPCLAFFMGAGARLLDSADRLEHFLWLRPIRFYHLLTVYLFFGLMAWILWLIIFLFIQVGFFGVDLLQLGKMQKVGENVYRMIHSTYPWIMYPKATVLYFGLYAVAFFLGNMFNRFSICVGACAAVYVLLFYVLLGNPTLWIVYVYTNSYSAIVYLLFLAPIPILLYIVYRLYPIRN